jgi:hypothetical protein
MSRSVITSCRNIGGGLAGARAAFRSPTFSINANPLGNGRDIPVLRRRFSSISRLPVELACCVEPLIPLHSAVASSRLTSRLAISLAVYVRELAR